MENLVLTLQTQREELLAAHAAASDRETSQQLVQQLKVLSEELELVAAASTAAPLAAALTPDFYASYLLTVLLARNLCERRAVLVEAHRARDQAELRGAPRRVGDRQGAVAAVSLSEMQPTGVEVADLLWLHLGAQEPGCSLRRDGLRLVSVAAGADRNSEDAAKSRVLDDLGQRRGVGARLREARGRDAILFVAELGGVGGGPAGPAQAAGQRATRTLHGSGPRPARHAV
ncbi:hypothetical protein ON010_g18788 [Phytophthora cinnamomi]|nr:hypothetical protein ON010_g18788 [Phytophthora cinnamomi]